MENIVTYGWFENGCLRTVVLEDRVQRYEENGEVKEMIVSVEHYIEVAKKQGLKPVDMIDEEKMIPSKADFIVVAEAVEEAEKISWVYTEKPDIRGLHKKIKELQEDLASTDYKVIKCYEANLVGEQPPYDVQNLHSSRQVLRDRINSIEDRIAELTLQLEIQS